MVSRRQFLRGDFGGQKRPQRPPWALGDVAFADACTRCGECVVACPQGVLLLDHGYPRVDFGRGPCTYCGDCVQACTVGALRRDGDVAPWSIKATIGEKCVAFDDVVCRRCADACQVGAISFRPRVNRAAVPEIVGEKCTGCGACVAPCPTGTIRVA